MIWAVNWWLAGLIGLVVGAALTWLIERTVSAARNPPDTLDTDAWEPEVDPTLISALDLRNGPGIVVGDHDEVLYATEQAISIGLVEGSRIVDPELLDMVRRCRREEQTEVQDLDVRPNPSVPVLHMVVRAAPMDEHGSAVVLADDRSAMIRVEQARNDFLANVSHELKTPIGAVSILAEAVEDAADDPDAVRHFATRLHTEAVRLSSLVTQVIALSRLQSDQPLLRAEPTDVSEVVHKAVHRMDELARSRHINLVVRCAPGLTVMGDPGPLIDAVANLVQNAIAYSGPRARVSVITREGREGDLRVVEIAVTDNGIGISQDDQKRIFERFYRVDQARSRASGGTGLGLSLVKHTARVHGGTVSVWSKVGQGSTFTLRFPMHHPSSEETS